MKKSRLRGAAASLLGLALLAAACGGSSGGGGSATNATVDPGIKAGVAAALGGSSTTAPGQKTSTSGVVQPKSLDEWEALWADQRAAIIKKIKDNKYGKSADGTKVTGPDGFTIDLTKCAAGWSDTEGLSDSEIRIGQAIGLSGTAADYGNIAKAGSVVYDYYSQKGAFKDVNGKTRKVNYIVKDDGYDSARTIPVVDELIDSDKVFAAWTLGSPNGLKVYDKLNQRCIPHPFSLSGHPAWGDPVNHPWTTGLQLAYTTEAVLWGAFIDQHISEFPGKVKVASLVAASDFGKAYDNGFKAYIAQSPNKDRFDYFNEVVEFQAPTVKDPMTTLASKNPDFFIVMTGGTQCTQIIQEAAENGLKDKAKYMFTSSTCKPSTFFGKEKVGGDGSAANGWWIMGGGVRDINSSGEDNNAYIQWARQLLQSKGIDPKSSGNLGGGFEYSFPMVQGLLIAGQLDGGLTRTNFITALRTFDMTIPCCCPASSST